MQEITKGTELKFNVNVASMDGLTPAEFDWEVCFHSPMWTVKLTYPREELMQIDENNYYVVIDTTPFAGYGIMATVTAHIPDEDCKDGYRTEKDTQHLGYIVTR